MPFKDGTCFFLFSAYPVGREVTSLGKILPLNRTIWDPDIEEWNIEDDHGDTSYPLGCDTMEGLRRPRILGHPLLPTPPPKSPSRERRE